MKFTVADTETASLSGGVCDIAYAVLDENLEIIDQDESLIDPERPIEPGASGIHHITDDMVVDAPTMEQYMKLRGRPFEAEGFVIAGHNIQFDIRMLAGHMPQQYKKVCTLRLARNIWPEAPDHKLQTLRYMFKLDAGTAHRAMGDVITCVNLLRLICATQQVDIHGLIAMAQKPLSLDSKMTFGKHKGAKLRDVPSSYVRWLLEKPDLDPDLREALLLRGVT